jgi:hypothetical protein
MMTFGVYICLCLHIGVYVLICMPECNVRLRVYMPGCLFTRMI